ncbi:ATP-binding cassette domain-containing protein [Oleiagrimonas sp. C23AA]|uniref:ABC transporter ATP-binding protein n=1 Tax=Oleiagrimonas sp. C23AA TaxID=2719047 RepID=UPI0031B715AE
MDHAQPLLEVDDVSRRLGGRDIVRDISFSLARGQVMGLLGVNGAGKSTTLSMLAGARTPSRGHIRLLGQDLNQAPASLCRHIGWLLEHAPLWPELTVREQIRARAQLAGLRGKAVSQAAEAIIERLALGELARRLTGILSQGQRQRVGLACALVHSPDLLVLDEPGNGLDPMQTAELRALIGERARAGCAVILSTHLLHEVTAVCDRVLIVHQGRVRHEAPLQAVASGWRITLAEAASPERVLALAPVASAQPHQGGLVFEITLNAGADAPALARAVVAAGLPLSGLVAMGSDLERTFMTIAATRAPEAA